MCKNGINFTDFPKTDISVEIRNSSEILRYAFLANLLQSLRPSNHSPRAVSRPSVWKIAWPAHQKRNGSTNGKHKHRRAHTFPHCGILFARAPWGLADNKEMETLPDKWYGARFESSRKSSTMRGNFSDTSRWWSWCLNSSVFLCVFCITFRSNMTRTSVFALCLAWNLWKEICLRISLHK